MIRTIVTPPAYFPLTLAQLKSHLGVDHANDNAYLQSLISVATHKAEQITRRRMITQTWKVFMDSWTDSDSIRLPFGQLQSVTHVKYTNTAGTETTWSDAEYNVDIDSEPGRIVLEYDYSWPSADLHPQNPIEIQFVFGYGTHAPQTVTAASNASPIVLTVGTHGNDTGDQVLVYDVGGNTVANGLWIMTDDDDNSMSLNGSAGTAAYTSGGKLIVQSVPRNIVAAILLICADMYENREDVVVGQTPYNLKAAQSLLAMSKLQGGVDA